MDKTQLHETIIKSEWIREQRLGFCREIDYGIMEIDDVLLLFDRMCHVADKISQFTFAKTQLAYSYSIDEGKATRKKSKKKGNFESLPKTTKVANDAKINAPITDGSIYEKRHKIVMNLPDGTQQEGIVRISDHIVDLGTWYEQNQPCTFGISIVIGEKSRTNYDKPLPSGVTVTVYEYVLRSGKENSDKILLGISNDIATLTSRDREWDINTTIGGIQTPDKPSSGNPNPNLRETKLSQIITETINNFIRKECI